MFRLRRAKETEISDQIAIARRLPAACPRILSAANGFLAPVPANFNHDHSRSKIGVGEDAFIAAKEALADWKMFDLGWVEVANLDAQIAIGEVVAVESLTLGLWTLNLSKIVDVTDLPGKFGFVYSPTALHVEQGEERFLIEMDARTNEVFYDLEAVSMPAHFAARLGKPIARAFQHKFARDSHRRLRELIP